MYNVLISIITDGPSICVDKGQFIRYYVEYHLVIKHSAMEPLRCLRDNLAAFSID